MAHTVDQLILNTMQSGVVTRQGLLAAGASPSAIDRRLRRGLLEPMSTGVYIVPTQVDSHTRLVGALAALPEAAVSRSAAGRLHRFAVAGNAAQVTVARGQRLPIKGVSVHETRRWLDGDIVVIDGLRVTSPARTLIDLASELSAARLRHITESQLVKSTPNDTLLLATFSAHRRRGLRGTAKMAALLAELLDDQPYPESVLEAMVWRALSDHGLSGFVRQFRPSWYDGRAGIVDFAHPETRLILEADGRRWHTVTQARVDDRRRDRRAVAAGWAVVRVGWTEVDVRPCATMQEIADVVAGRLAAARPATPLVVSGSGKRHQ